MTAKTATPQDYMKDMMAQTQAYMKEGADMWQQMMTDYTKMVAEGTEFAMNQSLDTRERMGKLFTDGFNKAQELTNKEQEVVIASVDAVANQTKASYQRMEKMFAPAK